MAGSAFAAADAEKTFNSLTGTPLASLRYQSNWLVYTDCLFDATTVRTAAARAGVHKNTSFRWRHRFLPLPKTDRPLQLHGITEADAMYLLESEKGARHLQRPAHKRGGPASERGITSTKAQLKRCLPPVIDQDMLLVSDANAAYRYFARDAAISHQAANLSAGVRVKGAIHVQNLNAYHSRFRLWLERFHGVATHYLPNYLGWRRVLDAKRIGSPEALLRAAIGAFPHLTGT